MGVIHGLDHVIRKLKASEQKGVRAAARGVTKAAMATAAHIKKEYRRNVTGKGFNNVSSLLRASIRSEVKLESGVILGYVIAGWGGQREGKSSYAPYVEFRWGGRYAYLWPGVKDMKAEIERLITEEIKGVL